MNVLEELREKGLSIKVTGSRIAVDPTPPVSLQPQLVAEGKALLRLWRLADAKLGALESAKETDPKRWKPLHARLCRQWDDEVIDFSLLVAFVGGHLRRSEAYAHLARKRTTPDERASARATISWSDRLLDAMRPKLLSASVLSPRLHQLILKIRG